MRSLLAAFLSLFLPARGAHRTVTTASPPPSHPPTASPPQPSPVDAVMADGQPLVRPYVVVWEREEGERDRRRALYERLREMPDGLARFRVVRKRSPLSWTGKLALPQSEFFGASYTLRLPLLSLSWRPGLSCRFSRGEGLPGCLPGLTVSHRRPPPADDPHLPLGVSCR